MRGEGIDIGDVSSDPEARAFRLARTRERELSQEAEAERLAASGVSGSGDFDARVAQLRERSGADISGFEAGLVGRRRAEAQRSAITGSQLTMQELARQAGQETTAYQGRLAEAGLSEQRRGTDLSAQTSMLSQLLADQARKEQTETGRVSSQTTKDLGILQAILGEQARTDALTQGQYQFGVTSGFQQQQLEMQKQFQALQEELLRIQAAREEEELRRLKLQKPRAPGGGLTRPPMFGGFVPRFGG